MAIYILGLNIPAALDRVSMWCLFLTDGQSIVVLSADGGAEFRWTDGDGEALVCMLVGCDSEESKDKSCW